MKDIPSKKERQAMKSALVVMLLGVVVAGASTPTMRL